VIAQERDPCNYAHGIKVVACRHVNPMWYELNEYTFLYIHFINHQHAVYNKTSKTHRLCSSSLVVSFNRQCCREGGLVVRKIRQVLFHSWSLNRQRSNIINYRPWLINHRPIGTIQNKIVKIGLNISIPVNFKP